jgi:uncharacterized RDD family membrane protein YckC
MLCPSCGVTVADGTAFCGSCGKPIIGYSVGAASAAAPAALAAGVPPQVFAAEGSRGDTGLYAGFWLRFVAALIDGIILGIPIGIVFALMIMSAIPALTTSKDPMVILTAMFPRIFMFIIIYVAACWLYWGLMESSSWQATLGKKALGLYVTDLTGSRVTFGRASGRFFAGRGLSVVPTIGGLYYLIDCIMAGFTEKKQALHDMIAGCLVQRNA